jgi:hypothetical protein
MRRIYKYFFEILDETPVKMPKGAEILAVQMQKGHPCIWALVNPDAQIELRTLCVRGTGHTMKGNEGRYIGTFQGMGGDIVLHVFEAAPK